MLWPTELSALSARGRNIYSQIRFLSTHMMLATLAVMTDRQMTLLVRKIMKSNWLDATQMRICVTRNVIPVATGDLAQVGTVGVNFVKVEVVSLAFLV